MKTPFVKKISCGLIVASLAIIAGTIISTSSSGAFGSFSKGSDEFSITYSRSTGSFKDNGNNVYTTSASSSRGNISYLSCKSFVGNLGTSRIASFPSKNESSVSSTVLTFAVAETGSEASSHYKFQFLKSISASISSTMSIIWHIEQSYDAINWENAGDMSFSSRSGSSTCVNGAKYLRITEPTRAALMNYYVDSITLEYSCSEVEPYKSLSSIEVVSPKTSYKVGDAFVEPSVTAYYDGGESSATAIGSTFTGYNMSVSGIQTVYASYTESGVTRNTSYQIEVEGAGPSVLSGSYKNSSTQATIDFDDMTYTYYEYTLHFTYTFTASSVTFTLDKTKENAKLTDFSNYRLFKDHDSNITNTTTTFTSGNSLTIKLYNMFGNQSATASTYSYVA